MSDNTEKPRLSSKEIADGIYDVGETLALVIEDVAKQIGLDVGQCVLLLPSIVSTMLRRLSNDKPGSIIRARDQICKLIVQFTDIDEDARRKRRH